MDRIAIAVLLALQSGVISRRQVLAAGGGDHDIAQHLQYLGLRTTVELDGRIGHEATSDRWVDLDRDLESAVRGDLTLRVGWKQVLDPCRLAAAVTRILIARGWTGNPLPCRDGCALSAVGADHSSPGA